jgi:hypothetical protein
MQKAFVTSARIDGSSLRLLHRDLSRADGFGLPFAVRRQRRRNTERHASVLPTLF